MNMKILRRKFLEGGDGHADNDGQESNGQQDSRLAGEVGAANSDFRSLLSDPKYNFN